MRAKGCACVRLRLRLKICCCPRPLPSPCDGRVSQACPNGHHQQWVAASVAKGSVTEHASHRSGMMAPTPQIQNAGLRALLLRRMLLACHARALSVPRWHYAQNLKGGRTSTSPSHLGASRTRTCNPQLRGLMPSLPNGPRVSENAHACPCPVGKLSRGAATSHASQDDGWCNPAKALGCRDFSLSGLRQSIPMPCGS